MVLAFIIVLLASAAVYVVGISISDSFVSGWIACFVGSILYKVITAGLLP